MSALSREEVKRLCNSGATADLFQYIESQRDRIAKLEAVCAEAYQLAGAIGAPVAVLDNLSAGANRAPLPHKTFLPIMPEDCSELATALKERDEYREQYVVRTKADAAELASLRLRVQEGERK